MSCFVLFSSMHDISLLEIQFGLSKALDATRFPGVRKWTIRLWIEFDMCKKGEPWHGCFYGFYMVFCCLIKCCRLWIVHFSLMLCLWHAAHWVSDCYENELAPKKT